MHAAAAAAVLLSRRVNNGFARRRRRRKNNAKFEYCCRRRRGCQVPTTVASRFQMLLVVDGQGSQFGGYPKQFKFWLYQNQFTLRGVPSTKKKVNNTAKQRKPLAMKGMCILQIPHLQSYLSTFLCANILSSQMSIFLLKIFI